MRKKPQRLNTPIIKWCLEHGHFSNTTGTSAVRYLNDNGIPLRVELNVISGKLFATYKNENVEPFTKEISEGETFYIEVRERKEIEK